MFFNELYDLKTINKFTVTIPYCLKDNLVFKNAALFTFIL